MSTENASPFASPAALPQASLMQQFPQSGVAMTPGQQGIAAFRQRGGVPMGVQASGGAPGQVSSAPAGIGQIAANPGVGGQAMTVGANPGMPNVAANPAPGIANTINAQPGQRATGAMRIRPPSTMPMGTLR